MNLRLVCGNLKIKCASPMPSMSRLRVGMQEMWAEQQRIGLQANTPNSQVVSKEAYRSKWAFVPLGIKMDAIFPAWIIGLYPRIRREIVSTGVTCTRNPADEDFLSVTQLQSQKWYALIVAMRMYRDPVVASDGFTTYERFALQRLLSGPRIPESPLTRERLDLQMFPNRDMQQQVEDWLSRQPLPHIYGIEHGRRESLLEFSSGPSYSHASVQLTEHAHRESSRSFSSGPSHTHTPSVRQSDDAGETSGASSVPYHMYDLSDESDHCHGLSRSSKFDYTMMSHGSHASTRESHDFLCHDAYDASNDVHSGDETGSESATVRLAFQRPHVQEARAESQQQSCGGCSEESSEPNNMTALRAARLARFDKK
jgi:hypothetical protein